MNSFLLLFVRTAIAALFLLSTTGCDSKKQTDTNPNRQRKPALDTAKIQLSLRKYEEQHLKIGDTAGDRQLKTLLKESIEMGYNDVACNLLMDFARFHADRGEFDSTLFYFNQAKPFCTQPVFDNTLPAYFLADLGAFYYSLRSDVVSANNSYYNALEYLRSNNLTENTLAIKLYLYLFATQEELGHPDRGLAYLKEAENLALKLNFVPALISVRTNLGNYYAERKDYQTAGKYFELAVADAEKHWNPEWHPNILMAALVGMASFYSNTGQVEQAIPLLERARMIAQENKIVYSEVVAAIELGGANNKLGQYQETIQLVTQALQAQGSEFSWYKEEGYKALMEAYEGLGQYKKALEYQRKLNAFTDSLASKEKTLALNELEVKYQTAIKDKEIAAKKLLIEQQHNKIARKNSLITVILVAAVLIVFILVIVYKNISQKQSIQELEINSLRNQQEINTLRSTMRGEEQERKRIARELHDGIGSMLASAIMRLSLLKNQENERLLQKELSGVLHMLQETSQEVRKTSHNIMPDVVDRQSLEEAISAFCETITQGTGIAIDVQFFGDTKDFTSHCKHVIYRIVQELVHNIVRHAKATHSIVQATIHENTFTLIVEDDGIGFDPNTVRKGIGLKNVEARVKSLFGELQVETSASKGTSVYIELNCQHLNQEALPM